MLTKLSIQNLALVENITLQFDKGLSVLTGETGAGKSVIVNALALTLGERADKESIRFGFEKAIVTAEFDISRISITNKDMFKDYSEDNLIKISRELNRGGKGKIKINNKVISLSELKKIVTPLAEILSQHAGQKLMDEANHLDYLDNYASLNDLKKSTTQKYYLWEKAFSELTKIKKKRDLLKDEFELLSFQRKEIKQADIEIGEEEKLIDEKRILDSARVLIGSTNLINDILSGEDNSIISTINIIEKELDKMTEVDRKLEKQLENLTDISYKITEFSQFIEKYGSSIIDDPKRIDEINLRLDEIYNLKKKYGGSEESILNSLVEIEEKIASSPSDIDAFIDHLDDKAQKLFTDYSKTAVELSTTRKKATVYLKKQVEKELIELAIEGAEFGLELIYEDDPNGVILNSKAVKPGPHGLETARILFSANPGEPMKPLVKSASGGEVSRVLLALKTAEQKNQKLSRSLLVFDEVDSGIGGKTAVEVGKKLKKLASGNQVLVITHLHQIARLANHHYLADKLLNNANDGRAVINVQILSANGIKKELSRMVSLPE
jgi:DNA repair protein RecN (Recombination protein N)